MKKLIGIFLMAMFAFGSTASTASAQSAYMYQQRMRIRQGVLNGSLTQREAYRLQGKIADLETYERAALSDGYLSWQERRYIEQEKSQLNREIYRESHDRQDRWDRNDRWDHHDHDRWDHNDRWDR